MKKLQIATLAVATTTVMMMSGCATKTQTGAAIGAGSGALLGSAVNGKRGAIIGAALGGITGAAIGANEEKNDRERVYYQDQGGYTYYIGKDGRRYYVN